MEILMNIKKERKLRKLEDEQWKEIPGSNGMYLISNYGRIRSFRFDHQNGQILRPHTLKGYLAVSLKKVNCSKYIHKIVAENWVEKPSPEHAFVIHIDGNKKNNHYKNLAWVTKEELLKRNSELMKLKNSKLDKKLLIKSSKLKESDVKVIKSMLKKGVTQSIIARLFKISEMQVTRIKRGDNWSHVVID